MNNIKSEEFDVNNMSREELYNLEIDIENDMESFEKITKFFKKIMKK